MQQLAAEANRQQTKVQGPLRGTRMSFAATHHDEEDEEHGCGDADQEAEAR
jgi:hypothetical protein